MNEKKIVNVASYQRIDSLIISLKSIYNQCDEINVCLNNHTGVIPEFLFSPKINLTFTDNSKGDAFKFLYLESSDGYFLTIDDDLIYPPNYVEFMVNKCKEHNNKKIMTLHGRNFGKLPISSYYKSATERYQCLNEVKKDVVVQFGGTGVMCFHTSLLKKSINDFLYPNMADVWIGKFAKERNIEILCLAHSTGYIKYIPQKSTIFDEESNNDKTQTNVVNEIFGFKNFTNISIIIPTYGNVNFINECVSSIYNSKTNFSFEVLIGIDGCHDSLNYFESTSLQPNTKVFYFDQNEGPYSIKNTLTKISNSDKLLFFDSDDVMNKNMVETIVNELDRYICVKPKFEEFGGKSLGGTRFGEGVFGIKKDVFLSMNGFEPWMMAADSDFMGRLYKTKPRILHTPQVLFKRRVHSNSLTNRNDTGMRSPLRAHYAKISKNKKGHGNPDKLNVRDYTIVSIHKNILVSKQEPPKPKNSVLGILNRTPEPQQQKEVKEINYDEVNKVIFNKQTNKPKTNQGLNNQSSKSLNIKKKLFDNIRGGTHRESRRI